MLSNATILQIEVPNAADAGGLVTYQAIGSLRVRCALSSPRSQDQPRAEALTQSTSALLTLLKTDLPAFLFVSVPRPGHRVTVQADGGQPTTYQVAEVITHDKGPLSHWTLHLQAP